MLSRTIHETLMMKRVPSRSSLCTTCNHPTPLLLLVRRPPPPPITTTTLGLARTYASKKKSGGGKKVAGISSSSKKGIQEEEEDEDYAGRKGKKKKGGGKAFEEDEDDDERAGETEARFDLKLLEREMDEAVTRLRVALKTVVGRVGRVSPALLDGIKVDHEGTRSPLNEFATVTVKDGKDLLVTVYDEAYLKPVSAALYASPLSLTPQPHPHSSLSLRVPVPKPDWDKRHVLVRQAGDACEGARVAVRAVRARGVREIKDKVGSKDEGRSEGKKLDAATKKRTDEVDTIFEQAKTVLMDE
ncbi:ribosome recycling factor [Meredithblackwellia eburnea MCA 4105]